MAIKIGHAVHDENGGLNGVSGDQTGKEVQISKWYVSGDGWGWYIEAKDPDLRERMAVMMEQACANSGIGYSRTNRQAWYKSAKAQGSNVSLAKGDCDCSSLVSGIANLAGAHVRAGLSTRTMLADFKKSGEFNIYTDADHLETDLFARRGGIYLRIGHTLMVLQDGSCVGAEPPVDTIAPPYVQIIGAVNVHNAPDKSGDVVYVARNERLPYYSTDPATGWWAVQTPTGSDGFVSCNISKYAKLVTV